MKSTHTLENLEILEGLAKGMNESAKTLEALQGVIDKEIGELSEQDAGKYGEFAKIKVKLNEALTEKNSRKIYGIIREINRFNGTATDSTK